MSDLKGLKRATFTKLTDRNEEQCSEIGQKVTGQWAQHVIAEIGGASGSRELFFEHAVVAGGSSIDMDVDGSVTPVEFRIDAIALNSLVVKHLIFEIFDSGIKMDKFLGRNQPLTNGLLIEVKSQDRIFQFSTINTTQDFDAHFAFGNARSFEVIFASGVDSLVARFGLDTPLVLKPQGTYLTDDYIRVFVRDNLTQVSKMQFLAEGSVI